MNPSWEASFDPGCLARATRAEEEKTFVFWESNISAIHVSFLHCNLEFSREKISASMS
jgi:hypothetical protein